MTLDTATDNSLKESIYPVRLHCGNVSAICGGKTTSDTQLRHTSKITADYVNFILRGKNFLSKKIGFFWKNFLLKRFRV